MYYICNHAYEECTVKKNNGILSAKQFEFLCQSCFISWKKLVGFCDYTVTSEIINKINYSFKTAKICFPMIVI